MPELSNLTNPTSTQDAVESRRSESIELKNPSRSSYSVRFAGKPTRGRVFFDLEVQLSELFDVATSDNEGSRKRAAGRLLAQLYWKSHKLHSKLRSANAVYDSEITEFEGVASRADVLFPKSYAGQVLQQELKTAEQYQSKLQLLREIVDDQPSLRLLTLDRDAIRKRMEKAIQKRTEKPIRKRMEKAIQKRAKKTLPSWIDRDEIVESVPCTWEAMARKANIPEDYWSTVALPRFCENSAPSWWKFIWSRLKKRKAELLPVLRQSARGRAEAKEKPLYLKHFYKQFRQHWDALVKARMAGFF